MSQSQTGTALRSYRSKRSSSSSTVEPNSRAKACGARMDIESSAAIRVFEMLRPDWRLVAPGDRECFFATRNGTQCGANLYYTEREREEQKEDEPPLDVAPVPRERLTCEHIVCAPAAAVGLPICSSLDHRGHLPCWPWRKHAAHDQPASVQL